MRRPFLWLDPPTLYQFAHLEFIKGLENYPAVNSTNIRQRNVRQKYNNMKEYQIFINWTR